VEYHFPSTLLQQVETITAMVNYESLRGDGFFVTHPAAALEPLMSQESDEAIAWL
jgi:hypothetical protein